MSEAGWRYLRVSEGLDVTEDGEQCTDCLRFGYDPHQDVCLICGRGQLRPDEDDEYAELQYENNAAADLDTDWPRIPD